MQGSFGSRGRCHGQVLASVVYSVQKKVMEHKGRKLKRCEGNGWVDLCERANLREEGLLMTHRDYLVLADQERYWCSQKRYACNDTFMIRH